MVSKMHEYVRRNLKAIKISGWILFGVALYFYLNLFQNALIDDVFITLSYPKSILRDGTWGFYPGYLNNTATSPLSVILLTGISFFTGLDHAVIALAWICFFVITAVLSRISWRLLGKKKFGLLAALSLICNPLLISTLGLESILLCTLLAIAVENLISRRWSFLAVTLGFLAFTRPEGVLFFLIFLFFVPSGRRLRFVWLYFLCASPWYIFSWIHLGSFIPDTFFIKTVMRSWDKWEFWNGLGFHFINFPLEIAMSFVCFPFIVSLLISPFISFSAFRDVRRCLLIVGLLGLAHFIGYSFLHVPPFFWYYAPEVFTVILLGSFAFGAIYEKFSSKRKILFQALLCVFFLVPSFVMLRFLERNHFKIEEMPIHGNWATCNRYKEIASWLNRKAQGKSIQLSGEIGTLGYYSNCYLLDWMSDRQWITHYIEMGERAAPIKRFLFKLNFLFFKESPRFPEATLKLTGYQTNKPLNAGQLRKFLTSSRAASKGCIIIEEIKPLE